MPVIETVCLYYLYYKKGIIMTDNNDIDITAEDRELIQELKKLYLQICMCQNYCNQEHIENI